MVSQRLKNILQYLVIIGITVLLTWFSLRSLSPGHGENKFDYLLETWRHADKMWLFAMAGLALVSHLMRAARWKMLMVPIGYKTSLTNSFLSLMVGYLVNLVIPRGGEVSRCYNLYKLDKTPVEMSFGTVVAERVIDVVCLLMLVGISFFAEADKLVAFIDTLPIGAGQGKWKWLAVLAVAGLLVIGVLVWVVKRNTRFRTFVKKTWQGFREGLLSIFRLRNKGLFIFWSVAIWSLYFLMSYTVIRAFPETDHLGFLAVLSLFAIGSIAMAAPLPGGTGSYHVLVPQGLVFLYSVPQDDAIAFTFIFHAWQTAIMIAGGAISLIVTSYLLRRRGNRKAAREDAYQEKTD